jgi:mono/diheme cytochrome c family protein
MNNPICRTFLLLAVLLLFASSFASAQEKKIEKAPVQPTSAASGPEMYKAYCAVCHGKDGKGDGPAASELKVPPPDLTMLAKRHDGKYPADYVASALRNGAKAPAHGTADMPVWGPLFSSISQGDQSQVNQRIANLTNYIKSLQAK